MSNKQVIDIIDIVKTEDRINTGKLVKDLKKMAGRTQEGHVKAVAIVDKKIVKEDGTVMYEYIGTNETLIAGTQTMVKNNFAHLNPADGLQELFRVDDNLALQKHLGWKLDTEFSDYPEERNAIPRKIIGIMFGSNGASGTMEHAVNRGSKGFNYDEIVPFHRKNINLDNPIEMQHLSSYENGLNWLTDSFDKLRLKEIVDSGKYAIRVKLNDTESTDIAYLVKLASFSVDNIYVDDSRFVRQYDNDNEDDLNGPFKKSLDVRTRVRTEIEVPDGVLSRSVADAKVLGENVKSSNIINSTISSIMLVAGRPTRINDGINDIFTYRDIIVTNRSNFKQLPVDNSLFSIRYTIYYV